MVAVSPHSHYIYLGNFDDRLLHMFAQTVIDNTIWTLRNAFKRSKHRYGGLSRGDCGGHRLTGVRLMKQGLQETVRW